METGHGEWDSDLKTTEIVQVFLFVSGNVFHVFFLYVFQVSTIPRCPSAERDKRHTQLQLSLTSLVYSTYLYGGQSVALTLAIAEALNLQ